MGGCDIEWRALCHDVGDRACNLGVFLRGEAAVDGGLVTWSMEWGEAWLRGVAGGLLS